MNVYIKDIAYFQSRSQKICKIGDIRFYTKGFLSGITINDIPDIEENFNKIKGFEPIKDEDINSKEANDDLEESEISENLNKVLDKLTNRERDIVRMSFGIGILYSL